MTYKSLIGDMNAKTKLLEDVTVPDDSLFEIFDEFDNQSLIPYMYDYQNLILKGVSLITNLIICRHQTIMATD